jgi:hypothetical protein
MVERLLDRIASADGLECTWFVPDLSRFLSNYDGLRILNRQILSSGLQQAMQP